MVWSISARIKSAWNVKDSAIELRIAWNGTVLQRMFQEAGAAYYVVILYPSIIVVAPYR